MGVTEGNSTVLIRRAYQPEATLLSDLALRSKGHWGYDAAFLEACRTELTISTEAIVSLPIFVLEKDESVVGFYGLREHDQGMELLYLFVEPSEVNHGYGKLLWKHAVATTSSLGYRTIVIESDPFAEAFYLAMGARRKGETISPMNPTRTLPLMDFSIDREQVAPPSDG
jgi:GNAT superfamily N-acetyltransferase